jgi:hypothetical protein
VSAYIDEGWPVAIDIGTSVGNGLTVAAYFDPEFHYQNPAFWLSCARGHRTFATAEQCQTGTVTCKGCATDAAVYARLQEIRKTADQMIAAGRENETAFEDLIEAERRQS